MFRVCKRVLAVPNVLRRDIISGVKERKRVFGGRKKPIYLCFLVSFESQPSRNVIPSLMTIIFVFFFCSPFRFVGSYHTHGGGLFRFYSDFEGIVLAGILLTTPHSFESSGMIIRRANEEKSGSLFCMFVSE